MSVVTALRGLGAQPFGSTEPPPIPLKAIVIASKPELILRGISEATELGFEVVDRRIEDIDSMAVMSTLPVDLIARHEAGQLHLLVYVFEVQG
jgi:hypothetical protein